MLPDKAIDVHAHFLPPAYRDALAAAGLMLVDGGMPVPQWSPEAALELMDQIGVAGAMLSVSSPFAVSVAGAGAPALCRAVNDYAADLKVRFPDRFGGLAMLPVPMIDESLVELTRALDVLGLDGVALPTNADGTYLGEAALAPLLDALDERGAAVFVHPTMPCCFEAFGLKLPAPMIEFPFDTTRAIASLLYSGDLSRRGNIRFIFSHGGGPTSFLSGRLTRIGATPLVGSRALTLADAQAWLARWHYDLTMVGSPAEVAAIRAMAPVSQLLFGSDFPFTPVPMVHAAAAGFAALPFDADARAAILHGNAARLFPGFAHKCGCTAARVSA